MKQNSLFLLLFILLFSSWSFGRDAEFFNDANLRTRYENNTFQNGRPKDENNKEDNEQTFTTRTQLGLNMRKGETIKARVMFQHNFTWGSDVEDPAVTTSPGGTNDSGVSSPDGTRDGQNLLLVNEAWLWWKLNEGMALRFGRGQFRLGDGKVLSNNDYQNFPYALDGVILGWTAASMHTDFFAMKLAEYTKTGTVRKDAEMNLYGLSLNFVQLPELFTMAHVHVMQVIKDTLDTTKTTPTSEVSKYEEGLNYGRYGIAVAGGQNFQFKLSYAAHTGTVSPVGGDLDWQGSMIDGEVGYQLKSFMNSRVAFLFHRDTGNSGSATSRTRYDGFLYDIHENAGAMDIISFGNLTYLGASLQFDLLADLRVFIDAYRFGRTELSDEVVPGPSGKALFTSQRGSASSDAAVGTELDVAAEHSYENGLQMKVRFSLFQPEAYLSGNNGPATTISQFFLQSRIQF